MKKFGKFLIVTGIIAFLCGVVFGAAKELHKTQDEEKETAGEANPA